MEFIDLKTQQKRVSSEIEANIQTVLTHGKYIMGPEVSELEFLLSTYTGAKHAISCASGTDALLMALMAHGVGSGDAIFTTPFTFVATAEVIALLGATPVFVDIDPQTFNIDPNKLSLAIEALKSNSPSIYPLPALALKNNGSIKPKGIIPVDLFGLPADYDEINNIAGKHNLFVIEDACQSFGAEYKGAKACSLSEIACTSFFPAKPLGCYGDGGMCFTSSNKLDNIIRSIRIHGMGEHKNDNIRIGINGRMDTLQAAILLAKFKIFPEEVTLRDEVANRYNDLLSKVNSVVIPKRHDYATSVWAQYSLLAQDNEHRSIIQTKLNEKGIPTAVYYPKSLHKQEAFDYLGYKEDAFPVSTDYANRIFGIPMHPYLEKESQEFICKVIGSC